MYRLNLRIDKTNKENIEPIMLINYLDITYLLDQKGIKLHLGLLKKEFKEYFKGSVS